MKTLDGSLVAFEKLLNMDSDCRPREVIVETNKLITLLGTIRVLKSEINEMNQIVKELKGEKICQKN